MYQFKLPMNQSSASVLGPGAVLEFPVPTLKDPMRIVLPEEQRTSIIQFLLTPAPELGDRISLARGRIVRAAPRSLAGASAITGSTAKVTYANESW